MDLSDIQVDQNGTTILTGVSIGLNATLSNPDACATSIKWTASAGNTVPAEGSLSTTFSSPCAPGNINLAIEVRNEEGNLKATRKTELQVEETPDFPIQGEYVSSGFFGDINQVKIEKTEFQGKSCEKYTFSPFGAEGYAGVYYQYPPNNWGTQAGKDLSAYNKITFYVCSPDAAKVNFIAGGVSDETMEYKDSFKGVTGYQQLPANWEKVEIDLRNRDLSSVIGGFAWVADRDSNQKTINFYIADVQYERACEE